MTEPQTLPAHVQRVVKEQQDLYNNIAKLSAYVQNGMPGACAKEKELLEKQLVLMKQYSEVLVERIELHTPGATIIGIANVEMKEETLEEAPPAHVSV